MSSHPSPRPARHAADDHRCECAGEPLGLGAMLEAALRDTSLAVAILDRDHANVWSNQATDALLGVPTAEVVDAIDAPASGEEWLFFDADGDRYDFMAALDLCIASGQRSAPRVIGVRRPDGSLFWADTEVVPVPSCRCGARWYAAVISTDLTERRFAEQVLHRLAFSDPLTGLANRVVLEERLDQALRRKQTRDVPSTLFYFDLDHFKPINDRFGHEAGDGVLREVSERLSRVYRPGDTVARLGGDEFAVLAEELDGSRELAERARSAVEAPMEISVDGSGQSVTVGISIGEVATDDRSSAKSLLHRADRAMYGDKLARRR